jgi:uncharacterized protein YdhG (YjbR/CyaY superfamily)
LEKIEQVDAYIARLPADRQETLGRLRELVAKSVSNVQETMQYGMPTYTLGEPIVCAFASQKNYISFYMMDTDLVEEHKRELGGADCGKSCIRFRKLNEDLMGTLGTMLRKSARKLNS